MFILQLTNQNNIYSSPKKNTNSSINSNDNSNFSRSRNRDAVFFYDRERWYQNDRRKRIVVMIGPHKTACSSLQVFFESIAHSTISVVKSPELMNQDPTQEPHPDVVSTGWVWPSSVKSEHNGNASTSVTQFKDTGDAKSFAPLASFVTGQRNQHFFESWFEDKSKTAKPDLEARKTTVREYYRTLFRKPWEEGKSILIAAELLDNVVHVVRGTQHNEKRKGEELHVVASGGAMIDNLLDLFPWDHDHRNQSLPRENITDNDNNNDGVRTQRPQQPQPPLRLEDIEIQINLRTPRISQLTSMWKQVWKDLPEKDRLLQTFLCSLNSLHIVNSLGLALQFARKGIKTTVIDMKGVYEKEARENEAKAKDDATNLGSNSTPESSNDEDAIIGGLEGVVACDILRMGSTDTNHHLCDDRSRLHLSNYRNRVTEQNTRNEDGKVRNITDEQLKNIDGVLTRLDCSIWKYLRRYQASGTVRILYPSETLFATCDDDDEDVSFQETMRKISDIA